MTTTCRSCEAPIRWVETSSGRRMPLDLEPRVDGNVDVVLVGGVEIALVLGPADAVSAQVAGHELFVSHFGTCPQAGAWRRGGAASSRRSSGGQLTNGERSSDAQ